MTYLRSIDHGNLLAASFVSHGPPICGLGLFGHHGTDWSVDGGYTWLNRPVPMYWPKDAAQLIKTEPGFDTIIYTQALPSGLGFTTVRCFGRVCVGRRSGGCKRLPAMPMPCPKPLAPLRPAEYSKSLPPDCGMVRDAPGMSYPGTSAKPPCKPSCATLHHGI